MTGTNRVGLAPLSGELLVVSERAGVRRAAERVLEDLGLRAQAVATLGAAHAALRTGRPAAVLLDLPLSGFTSRADLPLPQGTRLLAFGTDLPGDVEACAPDLTVDTLRAALAPLLPQPPCPPPAPQVHRELMADLLARPGVLGVTLLTPGGEVLGAEGEALAPPLVAALYGTLETAHALGDLPQGGALFSAQLEFERRTLLIVACGELLILCALRDPSLTSLIRYLLRARSAA